MPPLFGYEGDGKFWGDPDDFDPWESNPYGIRVMSPAEDAAWRRFEDYVRENYGYGWSFELDTSPTPEQQRLTRQMEAVGRATGAAMQEFAIDVLTGKR